MPARPPGRPPPFAGPAPARPGRLPAWLGRVSPHTRTPLLATPLVTAVVLLPALALPVARLAEATSPTALSVFALVNLSPWRIKTATGGGRPAPEGSLDLPVWVPAVGFAVSLGLVLWGVVGLAGLAGSSH